MNGLCDYRIIQRDGDGFGRVVFGGTHPGVTNGGVVARVVREDDGTAAVDWIKCETEGDAWSVTLCVPQGGLYRAEARLTAPDADPVTARFDWADLIACVHHFGVGDLFVMAGQSNMSGYGKEPAYDPPQLGVHLYDNAGRWCIAAHPLNSVPDPIYSNNDASSAVSPGLAFGKTMARKLGIPIGLIAAAQGGTSLEAWNPAEEDCRLYKELISKIDAVGKFRGMIWYQGCNETAEQEEAETYLGKFTQTVGLWREKFGHFPIVTCQLNRHAWKEEDRERRWGLVREAQRQAARTIRDVSVIPTIDMYTCDGIHNGSGACIIIGERMAQAMLGNYYGFPGGKAPDIKRIRKLDERSLLLIFDDVSTLRTLDDNAAGMNIEDENGLMDCVKITVTPEGAVVTGERDIAGKAVFHAYWKREQPAFFLRDNYGMPMLACYGVTAEE